MVSIIELNSNTVDLISITKYTPKNSNNKSIVISSATGVLQNYYSKFAFYFCDLGFTVYSFDYNGIGQSLYESIKKNSSSLSDWAKNQGAVITHAQSENPSHKILLITHSIGGPLIGLNNKSIELDGIITVASQTGYWKYFKGYHRIKMFSFWHILIPIFTPFFGYFPAKKLGLFEDLPKAVVYQWMKWGKHPEYFLKEFRKSDLFFEKMTCPSLILSFTKDGLASKKGVDWFAKQFTNAKVSRKHMVNNPPIGHFGFFRASFKDPVWDFTEHWIDANT